MKVLILGGRDFLGRHIVEMCLARGWDVTMVNRGLTNPHLFPEATFLQADRTRGIGHIELSEYDLAIDTSGYLPRVVTESALLLRDRVSTYVFVSSISVYDDFSRSSIDEQAPVLQAAPDGSEDVDRFYGNLKVACEDVVRRIYADRHVILRPGVLAGPYDHSNRFTYWITRASLGGTMAAPLPKEQPIQYVDVRDVADFILRVWKVSDTFNVSAPEQRLTFDHFLSTCIKEVRESTCVEWLPPEFLLQNNVEPWVDLPLWLPRDLWGGMSIDSTSAIAAGLGSRPLQRTIRDVLAWAVTTPADPGGTSRSGWRRGPWDAGLSLQRESELLGAWNDAGASADPPAGC